jgi:hypothetical protein
VNANGKRNSDAASLNASVHPKKGGHGGARAGAGAKKGATRASLGGDGAEQ